ncbi:hypothetical protein BDV28DRAFT_139179 [Aspergillus coremiiformis]|uniref:Uncharacterized protein n=1 Tax=Aspergillus coremiiformis TaxID=138285 RepID=A0A5N6YZR1_9EURO|nr:hypothetical protein BDV28DRAFT_139179 [Aspergillus coremiiformis]
MAVWSKPSKYNTTQESDKQCRELPYLKLVQSARCNKLFHFQRNQGIKHPTLSSSFAILPFYYFLPPSSSWALIFALERSLRTIWNDMETDDLLDDNL